MLNALVNLFSKKGVPIDITIFHPDETNLTWLIKINLPTAMIDITLKSLKEVMKGHEVIK